MKKKLIVEKEVIEVAKELSKLHIVLGIKMIKRIFEELVRKNPLVRSFKVARVFLTGFDLTSEERYLGMAFEDGEEVHQVFLYYINPSRKLNNDVLLFRCIASCQFSSILPKKYEKFVEEKHKRFIENRKLCCK